jgi:hypothetical protein
MQALAGYRIDNNFTDRPLEHIFTSIWSEPYLRIFSVGELCCHAYYGSLAWSRLEFCVAWHYAWCGGSHLQHLDEVEDQITECIGMLSDIQFHQSLPNTRPRERHRRNDPGHEKHVWAQRSALESIIFGSGRGGDEHDSVVAHRGRIDSSGAGY